jgi:hypothetical protein
MEYETSSGLRMSTLSLVVGGNNHEPIEEDSTFSSSFFAEIVERSKIKLIKGEDIGERMWSKELIGLYW